MMMQRIGKSHIDESKELERYTDIDGSNWIGSCIAMATDINLYAVLMRYTDFASLGTVSDCMPIVGENRIITTLGLAQMRQSSSSGLRKFLE